MTVFIMVITGLDTKFLGLEVYGLQTGAEKAANLVNLIAPNLTTTIFERKI